MLNYRTRNEFCGSIFSFGAGTQSTAILLLMKYEKERFINAVGMMPDWIIFADTGAESYDSLLNLEKCKKELFPIIRVKNFKRNATTHPQDIPVFFGNNQANNERRCTTDWKIRVINKATSKLFPKKNKKNPVAMMMGISTDEITRIKTHKLKSIEKIYPLIDLNLSRQDCYQIIDKYGWQPVKSACYMCPYQSKRWHENKEIDKAIAFEKKLQAKSEYQKKPYLHPSGMPIAEVYKMQLAQGDLFDDWTIDNECDGICGV
jgi:hypothetical protein